MPNQEIPENEQREQIVKLLEDLLIYSLLYQNAVPDERITKDHPDYDILIARDNFFLEIARKLTAASRLPILFGEKQQALEGHAKRITNMVAEMQKQKFTVDPAAETGLKEEVDPETQAAIAMKLKSGMPWSEVAQQLMEEAPDPEAKRKVALELLKGPSMSRMPNSGTVPPDLRVLRKSQVMEIEDIMAQVSSLLAGFHHP